jgi:hypothetical protein
MVLIDRPGNDYLILMEDVTRRGGDLRDSTRPMTVAQVEAGLAFAEFLAILAIGG